MSIELLMRFDNRPYEHGVSAAELYAGSLDAAEWADQHGFHVITFTEHHGSPDGTLPTPFLLAAAMAARTRQIRLRVMAALLPLHDPISVAEQFAMVDILSGGRAELVIGAGYVVSEFELFGVKMRGRFQVMEERLEIIKQALAGSMVEFDGRRGYVTPTPVQRPRPPIYVGGAVMASARRAARMGDGFAPHSPDPALLAEYRAECERLGHPAGPAFAYTTTPQAVFVTHDPDATWKHIAPHVTFHHNSYAQMAVKAEGMRTPYHAMPTEEAMRQSGRYLLVTPAECLQIVEKIEESGGGALQFMPALGGLDPAYGLESLNLFADTVLPTLEKRGWLGSISGP